MQAALTPYPAQQDRDDLAASLPLYLASLAVTLAGVGAVGVTVTSGAWLPAWALIAVAGHGVSLLLRRLRVQAESVFYPVMLLGSAVVLQQAFVGSPLVGLDGPLAHVPTDASTALLVATLAVVRTFTLVTNSSLLFSPVPSITMLALVGSNNPNAEIPIYFGVLVLGALFITGYEAHLRRAKQIRRAPGPPLFHLLAAWAVTLAVALVALLFPLTLHPVLGPLSPFALPAVSRLRNLASFAQQQYNSAPVGQGPIVLAPIPVYEVYGAETGRFRTAVFTNYTGREWTGQGQPGPVEFESSGRVPTHWPPSPDGRTSLEAELFRFPGDPDRTEQVAVREVRHRMVSRGSAPQGVPALGRIRTLLYPRKIVLYNVTGCVNGSGHSSSGRTIEVISEVAEYRDADLRRAPAVHRDGFADQEALSLPQSTIRVQELARRIGDRHPAPVDKIRAFIRYIEDNTTYTLLEERTPPGEDAASFYLFNTKRGACDLAATALAVMCRSVGIPARVAVGYNTGEPMEGGWLLRQDHSHMWVEAFFPGYGWVPFDPSPPISSINDSFLALTLYRLRTLFGQVGGGGLDALLLVSLVLGTLALAAYYGWKGARRWLAAARRSRRVAADSPEAAVALIYAQTVAGLQRKGWQRQPWMTPREYLHSLQRAWEGLSHASAPNLGADLVRQMESLTTAFERSRYAGDTTSEVLRAAREASAALGKLLPRRRSEPPPAAGSAHPAAGTA
jgi:transglutaminase-like putative cysteine protease